MPDGGVVLTLVWPIFEYRLVLDSPINKEEPGAEIFRFLGPCTGGFVDGCGSKRQVKGKVSSFG